MDREEQNIIQNGETETGGETIGEKGYAGAEAILDSLIFRITEPDRNAEPLREMSAGFDPGRLRGGRMSLQYRDQLRNLYGEVLDAMSCHSKKTAEKEMETIVLAEKFRIRQYGRRIAGLVRSRTDTKKEQIRINGWIETEHLAGRCPMPCLYRRKEPES